MSYRPEKDRFTTDGNERVIRSFYLDAYCAGNIYITVIDQYMIADFVAHDLLPGESGDREGYKHFQRTFGESFDKISPLVIHDLLSCDDKVVARWSWTGKHTAEFMGVPATQRQVTMKGIDIFRLADGRIADLWQEIDLMSMLQQIMALPSHRI